MHELLPIKSFSIKGKEHIIREAFLEETIATRHNTYRSANTDICVAVWVVGMKREREKNEKGFNAQATALVVCV